MVKRKQSKVKDSRPAFKSISIPIASWVPLQKPIMKACRVSNRTQVKHPKKINQIIELAKKIKKLSPPKKELENPKMEGPDNIEPYENIIPKKAFQLLCKEVAQKFIIDCHFTIEALEALQMATEDFMVGFFEDAAVVANHAKRKTVSIKDIELVKRLRKIAYEPL